MKQVTVREYARLTTEPVATPDLDTAHISRSAFDWLCAQSARFSARGAALAQTESGVALRLDNYVGVLETPCGTRLEILPKTCAGAGDAPEGRRLLIRMLRVVRDLPCRETAPAAITCFPLPLTEWVMRQFLLALHQLAKQGLRFAYERVAEERPFLRGQLDIRRQSVQPPQRLHLLHIRHSVFSENRPEHRLLRSALERCLASTREADNWRLASLLRTALEAVPPSASVRGDFRQWQNGRHMAHYQAVRPWCELVLGSEMPLAVAGPWRGISLLYPMQALFERYVAKQLAGQLRAGATLKAQDQSHWLCTRDQKAAFGLRPDLLLDYAGTRWVLDTKWKRLDGDFEPNAADMYQLYVYGHKLLDGRGDLALIYPETRDFHGLDTPYLFSDALRLWVLSFNPETGQLRLPPGLPLRAAFQNRP